MGRQLALVLPKLDKNGQRRGGKRKGAGRKPKQRRAGESHDARPELKNLLADTGKAAIEADFAGTHTGEFAGIAPTGRDVRIPYSVIYDLRGDQISAQAARPVLGLRPSRVRRRVCTNSCWDR